MAEPLIGIGLPVYNGEPFLTRSLDSLMAQSETDFELVIGDNCSTDGTEEICRELARKDERVTYLRRERNIGVLANHNRLIHETRGEFFSFASSDDEYHPDRLAELSAALRAQPDAVLAFSAAEEIDENGDVLRVWRNSIRTDHPSPVVRMRAKLADPEENLQLYGLIRRSAMERVRPQAPFKGSDRVTIVELALLGPFVAVDEPLLRHRQHTRRMSEVVDSRAYRLREQGTERRFYLPNVEEGVFLLRGVGRAPLNRSERLRGYVSLWPWVWRNTLPMARNVAHVGLDVLGRRR